jgi:hypothetical protein
VGAVVNPITLVVWRDAVADPPEADEGRMRWTDQGPLYPMDDRYYEDTGVRTWCHFAGDLFEPADPQPRVWCDPTPPTKDALTAEDVREALEALTEAMRDALPSDRPRRLATIARLRRAIEALPTEGGDE